MAGVARTHEHGDGTRDAASESNNGNSRAENPRDSDIPESDSDDADADENENENPERDDASDAQEEEEDRDEEEEQELQAVGFGEAMSKLLQQNVAETAAPILAKRTTARMREIQEDRKVTKTTRLSAAEKREKERKDNVVPSHATAVKERQLRKIATRGVVALFNAIAKHQFQMGKTASKDDKKVKELSKENFLGLLKQTKPKTAAAAAAASAKPTWSALQDDYMMDAKLKDWDADTGHTAPSAKRSRATTTGAPKDDEDAWQNVDAAMDSDTEAPGKSKKRRIRAT